MHNRVQHDSGYENVEICKEWYTFSNFLESVLEVPGIQDWVDYKMGVTKEPIVFDKDYIHYLNTGEPRGKLYSPQTCCFITARLNMDLVLISRQVQAGLREKTTGPFIGIQRDKNGNVVDVVGFDSLKQATAQGWDATRIGACLHGNSKEHRGYQWYYTQGCRLPQQLELGFMDKQEYHNWRCGIDGENDVA